ncbi:MAG TPA: hypothetical protein VHB20_14050 [Verrucomicrobiae bacterium]|nr:hypothetical protein [Verrucomicrobiae bacterium]
MAPMKVTFRPARPWKSMVVSVLAALFFCLVPSARAVLQFDVFLGFDDLVPERSWFPITCELYNDGPAFNAVIEVSAGGLNTTPLRRVPVDLPTGTRKRIFLPVFSSGNTWDVRLVDESGKTLSEQTMQRAFKPALRGFPIIASLAHSVSGMPVFPDVITRQGAAAKFSAARLQTAFFSDNPLALEGINMLYLNSSKALELTVPQVTALVAWVEHGGRLVVGVDQPTDVNATPWLRNLLPCTLNSMTEVAAGASLKAWLEGAPPPLIVPEPVPHRRGEGAPRNFNLPSASTQNLPGIVVTIGPNGVTYKTNAGVGNFAPRQYWLSNTNGGFSRLTPAGLTNLLALRALAVSNAAASALAPPSTNSTEIALLDSAPLQVSAASLRDGKVLIGPAASPLAIQAEHGRGQITVLTFNPEREPFLSWNGRPKFWMRLAGLPPAMFDQQQSDVPNYSYGRMGSDAIFGAMIDSKQVHKLPLGWLLALLAAYLIVIGPLDQYWLKKINRQMLTWITFPCYVVLFSGLIYWIGFHLRNGELEWNELNVVDVMDSRETTLLQGQTYISIYSPVNGNYKLRSDGPFATVRGEFGGNYGMQESSRASVVQRGNAFEAEAYVPVWTSQLFVSDWLQRGSPPVACSIERTNGGWSVILENNLNHALGPLRLAIEGRIYDVGSLTANQSRTNFIERAQGDAVDAFAQRFGGPFSEAVQRRQSNFGNNADPLPDVAMAAMAACFISVVGGGNEGEYGAPSSLDLTRYARSGYGVLLAWDDNDSLTPHLDQFKTTRTHRRTLLRLVTPLPPTI